MSEVEALEQIHATSWVLGDSIDLRKVAAEPIERSPFTIRLGEGMAVLYRYGAVVLFGVRDADRLSLFEQLSGGAPLPAGNADSAELKRSAVGESDSVDATGAILLADFDSQRLRVVAEVLARSAVLSFYEEHVAHVLAELEVPVARLRRDGRLPARTSVLLRGVGDVLATELRMIGRAEVSEKPELVWDDPDRDRLYTKLADEYELVERDRALSRKLDFVMRSATLLMEALGARRSLHVEWAIFALILFEIVLML